MVGEVSGRRRAVALVLGCGLLAACESPAPFYRSGTGRSDRPVVGLGGPAPYVSVSPPPDRTLALPETARPGDDVYAATRRGMLTPLTRRYPARVYVPNSGSGTVDVIDQRTFRITGRLRVGRRPARVMPSWDLRRLWVSGAMHAGLVPIDPLTGRAGRAVPVPAPDDLYYTPDGRAALVMIGRRIDFRDARSMRARASLRVPCAALGHGDYTADQRSLVASCGRSGHVIRIDPRRRKVTGLIRLGRGALPQDVRLAPDGRVFYVADAARRGVWLIDAARFRSAGFVPTGAPTLGLYPSRDGSVLYVSHRGAGAVSLIDFARRRVVGRWRVPGAVSPGGGGVSADGSVLWLSGHRRGVVYAISTRTGRAVRTIKVGRAPRGLCVYPQPGRFSLGHTGLFR